MNAFRKRLLGAWRESGERWEAARAAIERDTGLLTWNPSLYGLPVYERFVAHYAPEGPGAILAFGLNPGKYGMSQTGLPFTDVETARERLPLVRFDREAPAYAPRDLHPFLKRIRRERSCQSVYGFLDEAYGGPEAGWRDLYVANPCSLLFLMRDGENVTPASSPLSGREDVKALRLRVVREAIDVVEPRAVVFLGQDVARIAEREAVDALGAERVMVMDHPVARGPGRRGPSWWATAFTERLKSRGFL